MYEDAIKEDEEQYMGSDDPDLHYKPEPCVTEPGRQAGRSISGETFVMERESVHPRATARTDVKLEYPSEPARDQFEDTLSEDGRVSLPITPMQQNITNICQGAVIEDTPAVITANIQMQASFWERMELRMTQPPPRPTQFDGNPSRYLSFRASFRDQVESSASLNDNEKMNSLLSYTTGSAKEANENYQGLPNGCRLALQVLTQRSGQNALITEAL